MSLKNSLLPCLTKDFGSDLQLDHHKVVLLIVKKLCQFIHSKDYSLYYEEFLPHPSLINTSYFRTDL